MLLPPRVQEHQKEWLDASMTEKETEAALNSLPAGKAAGRDGFNKQFL